MRRYSRPVADLSLIHLKGPRDSGPGERKSMLDRADAIFEESAIAEADVVRVDVPASGSETEPSGLRSAVEPIIPSLQSGSLFGGPTGLLIVDAQALLASEAEVLAELLETTEAGSTVVIITIGSLTGALAKAVKKRGETESVKKFRERDAAKWLSEEVARRDMKLRKGAAGALLERFGSDIAGISQALDQLAASSGPITRQAVIERFRNRPDEPMWHYADAVSAGDASEALRRLSDFWIHGHPLQLLGFLESELRQRSLAATAPDIETYATWVDRLPSEYPVKKTWSRRGSVSDSELTAALHALRKADEVLKTAPPEVHRVTMERLTVALARWYGGKARRAS